MLWRRRGRVREAYEIRYSSVSSFIHGARFCRSCRCFVCDQLLYGASLLSDQAERRVFAAIFVPLKMHPSGDVNEAIRHRVIDLSRIPEDRYSLSLFLSRC